MLEMTVRFYGGVLDGEVGLRGLTRRSRFTSALFHYVVVVFLFPPFSFYFDLFGDVVFVLMF